MKETPENLFLNYKEYGIEWAKLENDIYKKKSTKKLSKIEHHSGSFMRDLPSQDDFIVTKKWKSLFWQRGKKFKTKMWKYSDQIFCVKFFILLYFFYSYTVWM